MPKSGARLSTGLAGLDAQLGGGVPPGTVHILLSEPMNAQELFTYHFTAPAGANAEYFTTDTEAEEILEGLNRIGAKEAPPKVIPLPHEGRWSLSLTPGLDRVIVDSFSHYGREVGWEQAQQDLAALKAYARSNGAGILLTISTGLHSQEETTLLKLWADGVMELGLDRQGFGLYPFLKVTKMRGVPDSARFLLFKETERGLFMESTRRVF